MKSKRKPLVSIIIPTYRSVETLKHVLKSIKNQTYGNIEVVVVDRPSRDGTEYLVKRFGYKFIAHNSERAKAVNLGVKHSLGDFIYYLGSDYVLEKNLVEKIVEIVLKEKADAVIIPNLIKPTGFWSRVRQLEKETYVGDDLVEAARFFSKKAFLSVGGYHNGMVAYEEHDLHNRLANMGYKIVRVKGAKEINIGEPNSLWIYAKKNYYYGKTIGEYLKKYPRKSISQLNPFRHSYFRKCELFLKHPILAFGFVVFQFVRYLSASIGYLTGKMGK